MLAKASCESFYLKDQRIGGKIGVSKQGKLAKQNKQLHWEWESDMEWECERSHGMGM